ncbi:DUF3958 domain-containing protein [Enterococcus mundtii]|uniref:DUF3958 family protein n=1 Tax=Enterococcus TaxID=1350 RepID=UPI0008E6DF90|nr:DUF3958 family protein [Enterococcus mundtii]AUB52803.1 hypothetical protein EM4838_07305 [Enterococcus mundtii]NAA02654.1 DUF3958 domain-containing protein [Enterococcus mundtii]NAA91077.1 DUF3958 domain-containing protein [Enterococcus mundtii]NAA92940.1 DUF3958 domain-containing protein [Enterococcus mundtii]NAA92942.1 DUF3958 domain-containing protein [Enterococcus mundtii]
MNQWINLDTEETLLQAKREEQEKKMKQLDACRSDYQNHFKEIGNFLFRLQLSYQKSNTFTSIETFTSEFSHQSRRLMNGFDECQHYEMIQQQKITQKLDEISFEKRKILLEDQNT